MAINAIIKHTKVVKEKTVEAAELELPLQRKHRSHTPNTDFNSEQLLNICGVCGPRQRSRAISVFNNTEGSMKATFTLRAAGVESI